MSTNRNLHEARKVKNDEFYTKFKDIEHELAHYKQHFQDKTVFLNCDDPEESNFWRYFLLNFSYLGLKRLVSTHYEKDKPSYMLEASRVPGATVVVDLDGTVHGVVIRQTPLEQNGDFRSPESVAILREADVVVTNPPFSLFREYVNQLMKYEKSFVIVGPMNAITYRDVFSYIKANRLWLGYTQPKDFLLADGSIKKFGNVLWFTNLDIKKRHEEMLLWNSYYENLERYPRYDNYEAIEVSRVSHIPYDYEGIMGVPITFLLHHNAEQFEIIGVSNHSEEMAGAKLLIKGMTMPVLNGKRKYVRLFIRNKHPRRKP